MASDEETYHDATSAAGGSGPAVSANVGINIGEDAILSFSSLP